MNEPSRPGRGPFDLVRTTGDTDWGGFISFCIRPLCELERSPDRSRKLVLDWSSAETLAAGSGETLRFILLSCSSSYNSIVEGLIYLKFRSFKGCEHLRIHL